MIECMRFPTEKAHGVYMAKQSEAFVRAGATVELWHPRMPQPADLKGVDPLDYYGIRERFPVRQLSKLCTAAFDWRIPAPVRPLTFSATSFAWAATAAWQARKTDAHAFLTSDLNVAFWLTQLGLPTVLDVHRVPRRRLRMSRLRGRRSLRLLVATTEGTKADLTSLGFDPSRITVLGNGVDLTQYDDLPVPEECRRRLSLPLDRSIVGYVGRFETMGVEKGIIDLIDAFSRVERHRADLAPLLLCVGGPGELIPRYRRQARAAGVEHALFFDRVATTQVPIWLRALDVAVIPFPAKPHYERHMSPLKMFEFMAAGLPIVATDLPATSEVLHHRENAWLVPPGDVTALADGLSRVLEDPRLAAQLGSQAAADARSRTWEDRARAILDFALSENHHAAHR